MGIELDLPGGNTVSVSEVFLTREIAAPVRWRFICAVRREALSGPAVEQLAKAVLTSPFKLKAAFRGPGEIQISPEATVVAARWATEANFQYLEIQAETTAVELSPDPFLPRRRVHKARDMKELVGRFAGVAMPLKALKAEFERIEFPDGDKSSIIQDGVSDWTFLFQIFDQMRFLSTSPPKWLPLALVGGVDEDGGTAGHWVIVSGRKAAYDDWGDMENRKLKFTGSDGGLQIEFDGATNPNRVPEFPSAAYPSVKYWYPYRTFEADAWKKWRTMDLPRFTEGGAFVWRIVDRIYHTYEGTGEAVGWATFLDASPPETQLCGPVAASPLRPWMGLAKVTEYSSKGPWIKAKIPGFEDGADVASTRISTPFSGSDGKKGLHFVPKQDTELLLCWTGRFDNSIIAGGNARSEATDFESPATYLEDPFTGQFADIHIKQAGDTKVDKAGDINVDQLGNVKVGSDFNLSVGQQTTINSSQQLEISADGADLKMSGGTVYTGKGF